MTINAENFQRSTAAPVGIVHVGLGGEWLRVNDRLCELLGYSREELHGADFQASIRSEEVQGEAESDQRTWQLAGARTRLEVV